MGKITASAATAALTIAVVLTGAAGAQAKTATATRAADPKSLTATATRVDATTLRLLVRLDIRARKPGRSHVRAEGCALVTRALGPRTVFCRPAGAVVRPVRLHPGRNRLELRLVVRALEYQYVYPPADWDRNLYWESIHLVPAATDVAFVSLDGGPLLKVEPAEFLAGNLAGNPTKEDQP